MMPRRLILRGLLALGSFALLAGSLSASSLVEKVWFFTTRDRLTVDVKLPPGAQPDWNASTLTLTRVGSAEAPLRVVIEAEAVRFIEETGVFRFETGPLPVAKWAPVTPVLYTAVLGVAAQGGGQETVSRRLGFRSFETKDGHLWLNGKPLFLRGLAINPPGRGIPTALEESRAFAEEYVRFMLRHHVNIIRIPDDQMWFDVCDELGMMVFGGNYAGSTIVREEKEDDELGRRGPARDRDAAAKWYRETKFNPVSHHPSLVIYALSNETPYVGPLGDAWHEFLTEMYTRLQKWDPTRLYIANAGYGNGRTGDLCDLHRYWGWYHSSPYTYLHLRDAPAVTFPEKVQPLVFTECVGNYGGPDGRINLTPNNKNPVAQLNWTGHAPSREQAQLFHAHQSFTFRQATELFRRLRPLNRELSGVFPFTILFHNWHTIAAFNEMVPRPVVAQMQTSYSPVLLSWELYTTQVYASAEIRPIVHLVNDADDFSDLRDATVRYELRDSSETAVLTGVFAVPLLAYYGTARHPLSLTLPAGLPTGTYRLVGTLEQGGKTVAENRVELFVASPAYARSGRPPAQAVRLFDPRGDTRKAFTKLGLPHTLMTNDTDLDPPGAPVVVGEEAIGSISEKQLAALAGFAAGGGRVLVLRQLPAGTDALNRLLPAKVRLPSADLDDPNYPTPSRTGSYQGMNINPERPDHPVFIGLDRLRLQSWSDYTGWDETKPGLPAVYPVNGAFILENKADLRITAILANQNLGLECNALAEFHTGRGSVLLSAFDLAARAGLDPVADRLLVNLVGYTAGDSGHEAHVLIEASIIWGEYETERGVLTGINSGLILNARPVLSGSYRSIKIVVHPDGHQFAGRPGGWNTRPGIQYVPYGRRPFGPYIHDPLFGIARIVDRNTPIGEGRFWCRIPAGKSKVTHRVWNPAAEPLEIRLAANGQETAVTLAPEETRSVDVPLDPGTTDVENTIRGDRRLVLIETTFQ